MQCSRYDDWNTVAAFQAITIYFLLRLSEDNDEATNFDIPLIQTMIVSSVPTYETLRPFSSKAYVNIETGRAGDWHGDETRKSF